MEIKEEVKWALKELDKEIKWRVIMYNKASDDKKEYWKQRIDDARRLKILIQKLWEGNTL